METVIAAIIVVVAFGWVGWTIWRAAIGKGSGCAGCKGTCCGGGCSTFAQKPEDPAAQGKPTPER